MPCGLPTRRYFQAIWCLKCLQAANPQILASHLVLEMPCGLPTRRYFQAIWCLKCPAGCQPAGTFKPFGDLVLEMPCVRAARPQVLSSHLVLEMPCGLPTRRYFQAIWCLKCPAGCQPAGTFEPFDPQVLSNHLEFEMPCGLPTRRYFQAIWCLKCPAGCQTAGTFKPFGA